MLIRIFQFGLNRYLKSPTRSWLIAAAASTLLKMMRSTAGRREIVDVSSIKPGEMVIIEHLPVSHKEQMKQEKRAKRRSKRDGRSGRRSQSSD